MSEMVTSLIVRGLLVGMALGALRLRTGGATRCGRYWRSVSLTSEHRRALELLASSSGGVNEELLVRHHHVSPPVLARLVRRKLVAAKREMAMADGNEFEVVRIRITAAGRRAIKE